MRQDQIQELMESAKHIVDIIENDDLMFPAFPPLVRLRESIKRLAEAKMLDHYNKIKSRFKIENKNR